MWVVFFLKVRDAREAKSDKEENRLLRDKYNQVQGVVYKGFC